MLLSVDGSGGGIVGGVGVGVGAVGGGGAAVSVLGCVHIMPLLLPNDPKPRVLILLLMTML